MWWSPEATYQQFRGTDAEFVPVGMPSPTRECLRNRVTPVDRCDSNFTIRVGSPLGVCAESIRPLQKLISGALFEDTHEMSIPEALRSPAHEALKSFTLTELDLDEIFLLWRTLSPRGAVCEWVAKNTQLIKQAVPRTYPRIIEDHETNTSLVYASTLLAAATALVVVWVTGMVYRHRKRRVIVYSQLEFLYLLLAGALTISIGALLKGLPPTDASCVAEMWLINIGYSFELVPLIVKVAAVNRMMNAARRFRRVSINIKSLFGPVFAILVLVVAAMTVWTLVDPPRLAAEHELTGGPSVRDRADVWFDEAYPEPTDPLYPSTVSKFYHCQSESYIWRAISAGWNVVLLLAASVLAFQTRKHASVFSETSLLAMLIYSHFVFVVSRVVVSFFLSSSSGAVVARYESIILSCDTLATILIVSITCQPQRLSLAFSGSPHRMLCFSSSSRNYLTARSQALLHPLILDRLAHCQVHLEENVPPVDHSPGSRLPRIHFSAL